MKIFNPINWFRWLGQFVAAYFVSFPWKEAPKAIPAIVLLIVLIGIGGVAFNDESNWRTQLLQKQLAMAFNEEDFDTVELLLRRQLEEKPDDIEISFRLADALVQEGDRDKDEDEIKEDYQTAKSIMVQLAEGRKDVRAAVWLIQKEYLGKNWTALDEEQKNQFGRLLKLVHQEYPADNNYTQLYADYLIASERFKDAVGLLEKLALVQPMRGLQAAALYRRMGRGEDADRLGEETLKRVNELLEDDPTNPVLALAVAQTQLFAKRYRDAIVLLRDAETRAKTPEDRERLRSAMGDAIVAWITELEESKVGTAEEEADLMNKLNVALRYAPDNPRVLTVLTDKVLSNANESDPKVSKLRETLVEGATPGISQFIKGTSELIRGNNETAIKHLKIAAELLPQSSAILNNLAVAMTARQDVDLDEPLKMIQQAIDQTQPLTTPHFYETRGQILLRKGMYLEAIPDFERALAIEALKLNAHKALAVCYEKIDEPSMAEGHRDKVKQMEEMATKQAQQKKDDLAELGL